MRCYVLAIFFFYYWNLRHEEVNKNTRNPYSSISRDSGNGNYEIMQLNDLSNDHNVHQTEHNECTYIEIIDHEYDYIYGDIAPVSDTIVWPLLASYSDIHIVTFIWISKQRKETFFDI